MKEFAYIITLASIVGTVANSFKKRWCFIVWGITNTFWIFYNIIFKNYAQALLYAFNLIMAIVGFIKWRDKPTDATKPKRPEKKIKQIEQALGFELFEWQKAFIFEGKDYGGDIRFARCAGKTIAHCLRVCLSEGKTIIASAGGADLQQFFGEDGISWLRRDFFINELRNVYEILNNAGIETRKIIFVDKERQPIDKEVEE